MLREVRRRRAPGGLLARHGSCPVFRRCARPSDHVPRRAPRGSRGGSRRSRTGRPGVAGSRLCRAGSGFPGRACAPPMAMPPRMTWAEAIALRGSSDAPGGSLRCAREERAVLSGRRAASSRLEEGAAHPKPTHQDGLARVFCPESAPTSSQPGGTLPEGSVSRSQGFFLRTITPSSRPRWVGPSVTGLVATSASPGPSSRSGRSSSTASTASSPHPSSSTPASPTASG